MVPRVEGGVGGNGGVAWEVWREAGGRGSDGDWVTMTFRRIWLRYVEVFWLVQESRPGT